MAQHSKACCSIPPVVSTGYEAKGTYTTINGLKTYVTGPESAEQAILVVYDIFGFFPQTLQGADIISTSDPDRKYRVFMPDFFEGEPADISWYPPQTDDQKAKLGKFFETKAQLPPTLARIPGCVDAANKLAPGGAGFKDWGMVGYCFGGKITSLSAGDGTLFKVGVQVHPAFVDPKDAEKVTIPMALLASKDESAEDVQAFQKALKTPNLVETWSTQIHGWMAARGDLADPEVKKEYENGYKTVVSFLHEHM